MQRTGSTTVLLRLFWLTIALGYLMAAGPALAEKRVALVIGNSDYQYVGRLDNPSNDARLMAKTLRSLGFQLIGNGPQIDLNKAAFDGALQKFGNAVVGADVALFYYAGHGMQVHGENFLVPISANPTKEADVYLQMVDTNVVLSQMEGAGTKLNIVVLDACRNNPFGGRGFRAVSGGLAQMQAPEGTLISYATQPGRKALDGKGADSPYSKALADTIKKPGLGLFEAFNEVGLQVQKETGGAQQPWVSSSPIAGSFYFAGAPAGDAKQPAPAVDAARQDFAVAQKIYSLRRRNRAVKITEQFLQPRIAGNGCRFDHVVRVALIVFQSVRFKMIRANNGIAHRLAHICHRGRFFDNHKFSVRPAADQPDRGNKHMRVAQNFQRFIKVVRMLQNITRHHCHRRANFFG